MDVAIKAWFSIKYYVIIIIALMTSTGGGGGWVDNQVVEMLYKCMDVLSSDVLDQVH